MFKEGGIGKISYSDRELSELTGLDRQTISRNNASLINKNYMSQVSLKTRESDSGCFNKETIYHLRDLGQAIIFTLMNHEDQINQNTKDIEYLKENFNTVLEQRDSAYKDRDKYLEEANH
jgi:DNA-binding MarR family transcriptional regulator